MAARYLLDTDICIHIRRHRPPQVLARFRQLKPGDAVLSVITYGELLYGAEKSQKPSLSLRQLEELTSLMPVMAMPPEAANAYGTIRAALESRGEVIGNNDLWIAAHARAADLILVTSNEREFRRVDGLTIQNWATGQ
jgi:tRNA(fMet)-specific endonuclease VapC